MERIIVIGLQAAGKSTFFHRHLAAEDEYEYVSMDTLRNNAKPRQRQMQLIESAFEAGHAVVVDNTNVTVEERALLISLGRRYGAEIIGYYFESQVSRCIERNASRVGKARVPDVAIYATVRKLVPIRINRRLLSKRRLGLFPGQGLPCPAEERRNCRVASPRRCVYRRDRACPCPGAAY